MAMGRAKCVVDDAGQGTLAGWKCLLRRRSSARSERLLNDSIALVQMAMAIVATVTPVIVLVRLIAGGQPLELVEPRRPSVTRWPLGVQEEEPVPWRFAGSAV
jgi:hypothetical protein